MDWLNKNGLAQTTAVAFIGDHGESLGRHGENSHGVLVYDATLHVPLILRFPGSPSHLRVAAQVRSIDLMPTLLELAGIPVPDVVQGVSVMALVSGGETSEPARVAYSESYNPKYEYGWSELKSLHSNSFHLIDAPQPELYDVRADPGEQTNIAGRQPNVLRQLERQLDEVLAHSSRKRSDNQDPAPVDPQAQERLAALGYVAGSAHATRGRRLANPKDKIGLANLIKEAGADVAAGHLDAASEKIQSVLSSDPDILAAYNVLGNLQLKRGDRLKAIDTYRRALARDPGFRPALFNLAAAYFAVDRPREAAAALHRLLELDPRDTDVILRLGQVALEAGDPRKAGAFFAQVLSTKPDSVDAETGLGNVALAQNDLRAAEAHFRRAANVGPAREDVHYNVGAVLHRRGALNEAEAEYKREIALHPDNVKAYHYLGLLYAQTDNFDGQLDAFATVVRLNPTSAQAHFLLGDALFQKQEVHKALAEVERAIGLDPDSEQPYLLLAAIHEKLGNRAEHERAITMARSKRSHQ